MHVVRVTCEREAAPAASTCRPRLAQPEARCGNPSGPGERVASREIVTCPGPTTLLAGSNWFLHNDFLHRKAIGKCYG